MYQPIAKKDNKTIKNILKASEKFFRTIAGIFIVYIIALTIIYPILVRNEFSNVYTISLILIIAISTFAEYFFGMTYRLYLQAEQKTYIISIIQVFTYILSTITIVILAKLNVSIQIIKLVSSIIFVLRPLLQNYYVRKKYNMNLKDAEGNYKIKQKWDGLAQHVAAVIHSNTDITILTFFCSLTEVSVYSVYYLVVAGIRKIIEAFSSGIDASWGDMIAKNEYKNLNEKFDLYEVLYFIVCTIVFASAIVLIVPFVSVYTRDINDANYIRYTFGYLIVISEFIWAIRLPYSSIILAAGHFKETRIGAWIEAISNIVISIVLVFKFGIIGVTIGTIVAMIIRTIEFIYHTNKYILKRNIFESIKKVFLIVIETIIIFILFKITPQIENTSYVTWSINAIIVSIEACIVTVLLNIMMYQKDMKKIFNKVKGLLARKEI